MYQRLLASNASPLTSFNVTVFRTIRKPTCVLTLVNNTNLHRISKVCQILHGIDQIIAFDNGVPVVNALVLGNLCKYHRKSYSAKN